MILRRYNAPCPACGQSWLIITQRPSSAAVNKYLPPAQRGEISRTDDGGWNINQGCSSCGASIDELEALLKRDGVPAGAQEF